MSPKSSSPNLAQLDESTVFPTDPTMPRIRCDEALPLGNGLLGALVWLANDQLCISLNRSDLWDERRPAAEKDPLYNWQDMCRLIAANKWDKLTELFRKAPTEPYPTLLPGGRLEIAWQTKACKFSLNETTATAQITTPEKTLEIFVPSGEDAVCRWRLDSTQIDCILRMPLFEENANIQAPLLGYKRSGSQSGNRQILCMELPGGNFAFALASDCKIIGNTTEGATVVAVGSTAETAAAEAGKMLDNALKVRFEVSCAQHKKAWHQFHKNCNIKFKDRSLTALWRQARYFFNCNARKGRPAAGLPGVWAIDDQTFPICRGDYHHNLNTQFTYLGYPAANDLAGGREFLDFMFSLRNVHKAWAQSFYGIKNGIVIPGAMTQAGGAVPGIVNYTYHPDNGLWVAWMFYRHWRYTLDDAFLKDIAYPYVSDVARGAIELAALDANNKYIYPWHAFPELGDEQPESYFKTMTAYVNSNLHAVLTALSDMADKLQLPGEQQYWQECLTHCREPQEFAADFDYYLHHKHVLGVQPGKPLDISHRHHSHLMSFYPYDVLDTENDAEIRQLVTDSIDQLDFLGTGLWVGFSLNWAAIMAMRIGNARKAFYWFDIYRKCFLGINGFYYNGDFKNTGCSAYKYRPFTLESIFAGQELLQESVLSESRGILKFFPGMTVLQSAEFKNLRAPGAFLVSGKLKDYKIRQITICSEAGAVLRFANNSNLYWNIVDSNDSIIYSGSDRIITLPTAAGKVYILTPEL
ncbi:MAG: hypothetical protein E7047_03665 [Lentisphaerae bacterium]|nr:hypothetical protein [Lentisphaerota bacterium]